MAIQIKILEAEAGQKVLRYLERSLDLPRPLLFRWLRTGQVRVNKGRVRHEQRLRAGDELRLPPQAEAHLRLSPRDERQTDLTLADLGPDLRIVFQDESLLVLDKGPGLPVQPGSKQSDSVSARLALVAGNAAYKPAPAHRLDRASSGLILAARTHACRRFLHGLFVDKGALERDYLAWVKGVWDVPAGTLLADTLGTAVGADGFERVTASPAPGEKSYGAEALFSTVRMLEQSPCGPATLLRVRLLSGRKHQIRVQCASRGYPIIGDPKYSGPRFKVMLLHAAGLKVPEGPCGPARSFLSLPSWPEPFGVEGVVTDET